MAWPHVVILEPLNAGLAVARRMVRLGARVTVVATPSDPWALRSRGVEGVEAEFEPDGEPWLDALLRATADGGEAVVLPATDRGSELLVAACQRLPEHVRTFERPDGAHLELMHKERAEDVARSAGVAVPWTARIVDEATLERALAGAPWPCVLKPALSHAWRQRYGLERVLMARDAAEARAHAARPLADGFELLLAEYVPGGDDAVEEAIVVRTADGAYPVRFGCRKLRQWPRGFGATALGESSPLPETMAMAERVLDAAGFAGVAGVEVKRHAVTGRRYFLEVNVRLPGQWGLGDACGADATRRLVAAMAGRALGPEPGCRAGVRFLAPDLELHAAAGALRSAPPRRRPAQALSLVRSYAGVRELGLLDPRDPGPGLAAARTFLGRRLGRGGEG